MPFLLACQEEFRGKRVRVAYIRLGKGLPTEAEQRSALEGAGLTAVEMAEVYVDKVKLSKSEEPAWDYMMGALRTDGDKPDEVCIARPAILANTEAEARQRIVRLTAQGAVLVIASSGRRYKVRSDAAQDVADALQLSADVKADERALVMAKARAGLKNIGRKKFTPQQWKDAHRLWADKAVTAEDAAKRSGIAQRTLYRKLGPKGTEPFGRPAKGRAKRK